MSASPSGDVLVKKDAVRFLFGCLAFALGCSGPSIEATPPPPPTAVASVRPRVETPTELKHLDARVQLVEAGGKLSVDGDVVWHIRLGTSRKLTLDAIGFEVASVTQGGTGADLAYEATANQLTIGPVAGQPGDEAKVQIRYHVTPAMGLMRDGQSAWTAFHTWQWLPVASDPSRRSTVQLGVSPPADWEGAGVIATGDGPMRPGPDLASAVPHPSYLWGFYVGVTQLVEREEEGLPVEVWTRRPKHRGAELAGDRTAAAWQRWRDSGGPWPGGDTPQPYLEVFVPGDTKQELVGMTFLPERYLDTLKDDAKEDWLLVHELVHQVWGNRVTCATWGDFWLNEAVAVWWVGRDKLLRGEKDGYERERALWRKRVDAAIVRGDDLRIERPGVAVKDAGGTVVYHGGALVVHELAEADPEGFTRQLHRWGEEALDEGHRALTTQAFLDRIGLAPDARTRIETMLASVATVTDKPKPRD